MTKGKQWRDLSFSEKFDEMQKTEEGRKILEEGHLQSEENELMDLEEGKYSSGFIDDEEDIIGNDYKTDDGESDDYDESDDYTDEHVDDTGFLEEQEAEQKQEEEEWAEQVKYETELRASIAFEKQDGSIISSVVEKWGGEFGRTLIEHYNDEKSALKVSEVGSIDPKEDYSELQQTIKKLIQNKNKNNRTKELQVFDNFDEYDKYIKDTRDIDCAYLWRNKSWEFLEWIFEYDQNDYGIDITKDEYLPRLVLSSTSLKKEKNKSKFIKFFTSWSSGNWESIPEKFVVGSGEITDDLPF